MFAVRRVVLAVALLTVFTFGRQASAQSVLIEPKLQTGGTNYLEQRIEVTQKIEGGQMPGGAMEIGVDRVYGLNEKIEPTSDGAKITMTFDRTMQKIDSPFMSGAFDSDVPDEDESPMIAAPLKAMVGGTFNMEVDKEGKIKNFSGMKTILDKVEEAAGGNPFLMQLRNELSDERGKSTYGEQLFLMYPNKEVKVGETWAKTHHDVLPQIGKVVSHYDYKLDRVGEENGHKVAMISFSSKTEKDTSAKSSDETPGANSKVEGDAKGHITFDIDRGIVTKQVTDGRMNVEISRGGPPKKKDADKAEKDAGKTKTSKDDDEDDDDQPKPMSIKITLKQTSSVLPPSVREKQKSEAAVKAKASQEKMDAKPKPKKKPVKKPADDDDD